MGKIKNRVLSGTSGKKGNLAGSSWRGISFILKRPARYKDEQYFLPHTNAFE